MNYTKGDWTVLEDMGGLAEFPEGHIQIVGDKQRENIAIIPERWNNPEANANLIAAAPMMYEALLEYMKGRSMNDPAYQVIIKALAQAEGKGK